ncbi:MAG: hypothetical protein ACTSUD_02075 [Alphaproteobacteria bacterium]
MIDLARTASRILAIVREDRLLLAGLVVLVCLDIGFVALHFGRELAMQGVPPFTELRQVRLSLLYTGSYGDQYSRVLAALIFLALGAAYARRREPVYGLAAGAYLTIFIVATFRLHHPAGEALGDALGLGVLVSSFSSRVGAALVLGLIGAGSLAAVLWGAARSTRGPAQAGLLLAACIVGLGLFSGGLRLLNIVLSASSGSLGRNMMAAEEGGELFVLTATLVVAVAAARCPLRLSIAD